MRITRRPLLRTLRRPQAPLARRLPLAELHARAALHRLRPLAVMLALMALATLALLAFTPEEHPSRLAGLTRLNRVMQPVSAQASTGEVTVELENDTFVHPTEAANLAEFFDELSLYLPYEYMQEQKLDLTAPPPAKLRLPRVAVARISERQSLLPEVEYRTIPTQGEARVEVLKPGTPGEREVFATYFYLAGELVGERIRVEPLQSGTPRVIAIYETAPEGYIPTFEEIMRARKLTSREWKPPTRYVKKLTMEATAYEPGPTSNGRWASGYTACGYEAGYGVVAVDPDVIPLNTRLYIEGYGYAIAGDTGGAIKGNIIDLGFETVEECYEFGRRDVVVYVLD
jgi:3D (Asp-Asp-Asp) domain-containing protein